MALLVPASLSAQIESVLPVPRSVQPGAGRLTVDSSFRIAIVRFRDARLERGVSRALARLEEHVTKGITRELGGPVDPATLRRHTVAAGETLSSIAEQYNVTPEEIQELNGIDDPNSVQEGQELLIPPE